MISRAIVLSLMTLALFSPVYADEITVQPKSVTIAEPVEIRLVIDLAADERVRLPEKLPLPEDVEIVSVETFGASDKDVEKGETVVLYKLAAYRLGSVKIPEFEYKVVSPDGAEKTRKTGPVSFMVESVRKDPETADNLKDIKPPVSVKLRWGNYILPVIFLLAVILAVYFLWRWWVQRPKITPAPPPPPLRPPHEIAYAELEKLKAEDPFAAGRARQYFFRLSEIVRKYLEARYGLLALERTTDELETEFDSRYAAGEARLKVLNLLKACDLVKFANRTPERRQADDALQVAFEVVEMTSIKETKAGEVR